MRQEKYDVVGIGHALVDASFSVQDTFLLEQGLPKGQMTLCDRAKMDRLRAALPEPSSVSAGGSCSNSLALLGRLGENFDENFLEKNDSGARYAFVGRVGSDAEGADFRRSMEQSSIECRLEEVTTKAEESGEATGQCLVMVTRDAQRTFATHLGASSDIAVSASGRGVAASSAIFVLGGLSVGRQSRDRRCLKPPPPRVD